MANELEETSQSLDEERAWHKLHDFQLSMIRARGPLFRAFALNAVMDSGGLISGNRTSMSADKYKGVDRDELSTDRGGGDKSRRESKTGLKAATESARGGTGGGGGGGLIEMPATPKSTRFTNLSQVTASTRSSAPPATASDKNRSSNSASLLKVVSVPPDEQQASTPKLTSSTTSKSAPDLSGLPSSRRQSGSVTAITVSPPPTNRNQDVVVTSLPLVRETSNDQSRHASGWDSDSAEKSPKPAAVSVADKLSPTNQNTAAAADKKYGVLDMMRNPVSLEILKDYMQSSLCVEQLMFLIDIQIFRDMKQDEPMKKFADHIIDTYLREQSLAAVNVSAASRERVTRAHNQGKVSKTMFDETERMVIDLIETDIYRRFVCTEQYKLAVKALCVKLKTDADEDEENGVVRKEKSGKSKRSHKSRSHFKPSMSQLV